MCCSGSMPYSTQLNAREILENKENLYHAALKNQNFRPHNTGREAGLAHSIGTSAVELSCNSIGLDCQTIVVCRTQTHVQ
jgi:hypothetical protein